MAEDPYQALGVNREASADDIRSAYRKLAKQHHPDLNPGSKAAEDRFKAIASAYDLLSDAEKRARFDRGEIDAAGQERPQRQYYRSYAEGAQGRRYQGAGPDGGRFEGEFPEELGDILGEFFRARGGGGSGEQVRMRGQDIAYRLTVDFLDAINGASRRLTLPDGKELDVSIPPGVEDGQTLRLRGQGGGGIGGGAAGDALIEIAVAPHPQFRREGNDIHVELPVSLREAVLGGRVEVPTPRGPVTMTIPKHSDTGARLRLRGRGVAAHAGQAAGDEYVTLKVAIGTFDEALEEFVRNWKPADPRRAQTEAA
ncbi:MAG: DnaJ domain-containing protein [Alphaproteobacteria bacterium]|nr:DnaJ domain-containing protein [Alphaproteobacteria bacterium]